MTTEIVHQPVLSLRQAYNLAATYLNALFFRPQENTNTPLQPSGTPVTEVSPQSPPLVHIPEDVAFSIGRQARSTSNVLFRIR